MKSFFNSVTQENNSEPLSKTIEGLTSSLRSMPSILSKDIAIQGDIKSSGVLEIEGKVNGTIKGNNVVIREGGNVEGKVDVDSITIRGNFTGDIKAKNISIFKKAQIVGNLEYEISLSVEDGASIDGQFKRTSKKPSLVAVEQSNIEEVKS